MRLSALLSLTVALWLSGCETQKNRAIHGTVTRGGEKLTWPDGGYLLVIFFPVDRTANTNVYRAETDTATSSFTIASIPPGRYKIAVQQFDTKHMDALHAAFDPVRTTLTCEVTPDGDTINIEIPEGELRPPKKGKQPDPPHPG